MDLPSIQPAAPTQMNANPAADGRVISVVRRTGRLVLVALPLLEEDHQADQPEQQDDPDDEEQGAADEIAHTSVLPEELMPVPRTAGRAGGARG